MAESENQIPTLTDIAHAGNQEMLNHFDGHQFDDESDEESNAMLSFENADEAINEIETASITEDTEFNEIPSITIEDETPSEIMSPDFSEAMQTATHETSKKQFDDKALKQKIDQAIKEALPGIEAQLKGKLYSKFGI